MTQNSIQQTFDLAVRRHQSGQLPDAERLYRQVLAEHPNHAGAIHHLGLIALQTGRKDVAIQFIRQAIALQPGYAEAHCNLGNALRESGRPDEAALAYQKAIELKSNFPEAHNNLANVLADQGQFDEAIKEYRCAVALRPAYAQARNSLGNALRNKGRFDEAIAEIRQAISIDPNNPDAFSGLGNVFRDTGQLNEAIGAYSQAIALRPAMPEAHNNLGAALKESGQLDKAIAAFGEAISLRPNYAKAYSNLGSALKDGGLLAEAIEAFRKAIAIDPNYADAHSNLVYAMQFDAAYGAEAIAGELRRWNHQHAAPLRKFIQPHSNDRSPERPMRIGYVSADFRDHVVGRNLLPLFRNHDRREFEITCYAQVLRPDAITRDFQKTAREWRNIVGVSDEKLAEQIRTDRVDILVDLSLHMAGNRLLVFARKPAPIQITFGGYPGGTGLETMDYRLTDPQLDPPGDTESLYVEKSLRLPDSFWCYDPEAMGAPVDAAGPLPALQNGFVTFGCLNNFCKFNDAVLELWGEIMKKIPQSRLILLVPEGSSRRRIERKFEGIQVSGRRVELIDRLPSDEYMRLYRRIDLGLDTFPYNGHTTSLDGFWMGVPVVTLAGHTVAGRAGLSQLTNLGLHELIAATRDQYVQIAVDLARDLPRLAALRQTLRQRMLDSPLCDARRFTKGIESAYRQTWRDWCKTAPAAD